MLELSSLQRPATSYQHDRSKPYLGETREQSCVKVTVLGCPDLTVLAFITNSGVYWEDSVGGLPIGDVCGPISKAVEIISPGRNLPLNISLQRNAAVKICD